MTLKELLTGHGTFWHRRLHTVWQGYGRDYYKNDMASGIRLRYGHIRCTSKYPCDSFIGVITAEHELCMNAQQQESIQRKIQSASMPIKSEANLVKELQSELYDVRIKWSQLSRKLYEAES